MLLPTMVGLVYDTKICFTTTSQMLMRLTLWEFLIRHEKQSGASHHVSLSHERSCIISKGDWRIDAVVCVLYNSRHNTHNATSCSYVL